MNTQKTYIKTGLKTYDNKDIVYMQTNDIQQNLKYIMDNIDNLRKETQAVRKILILDSFYSVNINSNYELSDDILDIVLKNKDSINKDVQLVRNNAHTLMHAYTQRMTANNILHIWKILNKNINTCSNLGFRTKMCDTDMSDYLTTEVPVEHINDYLHSLFDYCQASKLTVLSSCIAHFYLLYIQPFNTNNSTLGRILQNTLLYSISGKFKIVSISNAIYENKNAYLENLTVSAIKYKDFMNITPFIDYMLKQIAKAMNTVLESYKHLNKRQQQIMEIAAKETTLTVKDTAIRLNCSKTTCKKNMDILVEQEKLNKIYKNHICFYSLNSI